MHDDTVKLIKNHYNALCTVHSVEINTKKNLPYRSWIYIHRLSQNILLLLRHSLVVIREFSLYFNWCFWSSPMYGALTHNCTLIKWQFRKHCFNYSEKSLVMTKSAGTRIRRFCLALVFIQCM